MANNRYKKFNKRPEQRDDYVPPFPADEMTESIEALNLREETLTLLKGANVAVLYDLVKREEKDFYRIKTFNKKNLLDVVFALKKRKMFIKPTPPKVEQEKPNAEQPKAQASPEKSAERTENSSKQNKQQQAPQQRPQQGQEKRKNEGGGNRQNVGKAPQKPPRTEQGQPRPECVKRDNEGRRDRNKDRNNRERLDLPEVPILDTRLKRPPKPISVKVKEPSDIYVKVNKGGKWGFATRQGKTIIEPIFDEVFSFHEELCCVEKDETFGFINRDGELVIPLQYECASSFSEGLACVYKSGKCGYINKANEIVIEFRFDAGTAVVDGGCRVKKDGKWGELNLSSPNEIRWIN